jgi:hypothetical protein
MHIKVHQDMYSPDTRDEPDLCGSQNHKRDTCGYS